jgi:UDP-glucose 4-epimerase
MTTRSGDRRALITGGMGFVGSHLTDLLLADGYTVTLLDNLSTGRWENVAHHLSNPALTAVVGSVCDAPLVDELVGQADVVFHLAAAVGVTRILDDPLGSMEDNVVGTEVVLAAAANHDVKTLIASTSEVYGKADRLPFAEDDDVVIGSSALSRWSYAASKMIDEFLGLAYYAQRGLPVVLFRLFNTVGPRQTGRYGMVVPRFVGAALRSEPLPVYGTGTQSRCFTHVSDAVRAIHALSLHPDAPGKVFNVGTPELVTILELGRRTIRTVEEMTGAPVAAEPFRFIPYEEAYPAGFEDMAARQPDTSRLHELTGWTPAFRLNDVLRDVTLHLWVAQQEPIQTIVLPPANGVAVNGARVNGVVSPKAAKVRPQPA